MFGVMSGDEFLFSRVFLLMFIALLHRRKRNLNVVLSLRRLLRLLTHCELQLQNSCDTMKAIIII